MARLIDSKHFLDLWFSLKQEVFRSTAPQNEDPTLAVIAFRIEYNGGTLVDVLRDI